jgi:hypothetical protein
VLRHTFFLGVLLRLELELPSGLKLRARMTKEEYAQHGLEDGKEISSKSGSIGCWPAKLLRCRPNGSWTTRHRPALRNIFEDKTLMARFGCG